jgi:DNA-directed RNA polymerase subunit alpha
LTELSKNKKKKEWNYIFIDQLELPPRIYNCLKKSNIHTLLDLLNKSQEDLIKIEHFRIEDAKQIFDTIEKKILKLTDLSKKRKIKDERD